MTWHDALTDALPSERALPDVEPLALEADLRSVGVARRFVLEQTADLEDGVADDVRLVTSELVTNAVVHARTALQVGVALTDEAVVVMVHDLDLGRREERTHERDGGRGLSIVAELSCASGRVQHEGGGKTYWARLCRCSSEDSA
ncbi:MAG: putative anti-sigma regulatory factor, serine/threonine protein kinase [Frankiales bacterium]|nr:putative anti-sigma regulatory factor, serine/threonine protein kinase [Frankiales bacterium]